jgi:hypothetical protein
MTIQRKRSKIRTAGTFCIWPRGVELMFDVSSETRRRWEKARVLPPRDVFLGGQAIGWKQATLEAATSGNLAATA